MRFVIKPTDPAKIEADILIIFCWEDGVGKLPFLNKTIGDLVRKTATKENFEGKGSFPGNRNICR